MQNKNILVSSLEDNVKIKLRLLKKVAKFNEINNYIKNHSVDVYITFLPMTIIQKMRRSKDSGVGIWLMILDYSGVLPVRKSSACFKGTSIL